MKMGRYEITIVSQLPIQESDEYTISVFAIHSKHRKKLMCCRRLKNIESVLSQAWFAIYKGLPLLAVSASGGQHLFTYVYLINPLKHSVRVLCGEIMIGEGFRLNEGIVVEHVPDQYVHNKPTWFHRKDPDVTELIPTVFQLNWKSLLFKAGPTLYQLMKP